MNRRAREVLLLVLPALLGIAAAGGHSPLAAQGFGGGDCAIVSSGPVVTQDFGNGRITWFSTPVFSCNDGTRIQTDSAVVFDATGEHELIGRVRMTSPSRNLRGDRVDYNERSGVLFARGSVTFSDPTQGTEISGDTLWFQAARAGLPEDDIRVTGRQARATFPSGRSPAPGEPQNEPDAGAAAPYVVTADRMRFQGARFFWAGGAVEVVRDSLHAASDSLVFNQDDGELILIGDASLEPTGLLFTGEHMTLSLPDDVLTSVVVTGGSRMETDEMTMVGGEIRVTLTEEKIERIVAVHRADDEGDAPRPYLVAEEVFLMSDSIDVNSPGEVLERIYAVGDAWSERRAPEDTLPDLAAGPPSGRTIDPANPPLRDWIEGDTIEIGFTQTPGEDGGEAGGYEITYLDARGQAGSFYRSSGRGVGSVAGGPVATEPDPASDEPAGIPAAGNRVFDYLRAEQIRMTFQAGEATHVEAAGKAVGVHVELPPLESPAPATNEESDD